MVTYIIYTNKEQQNNKPKKNNYLQALPCDENMNTGRNSKQPTILCGDTGGKRHRWSSAQVKLQALVYDILPSTTAVFSYAIGSRKLSANEQFFVGAQTVVSL